MPRGRQLLLGLGLILVLLFVLWVLSSGPDAAISNAIFGSVWASVLFAVVMLGSVGGLLALLAHQIPKGMSEDGVRRWGKIREKGKSAFVRDCVLWWSLPAMAVLLFSFLYKADPAAEGFSESVRNLIIVAAVVVGLPVFAAHRFWSDNERQYSAYRSKLSSPPSE